MVDYTSRLGLSKQAGSENMDIDKINANFDRLDKVAGIPFYTSTTRPTGTDRYPGMQIRETDTGLILMWDGADWIRPWYIERFRNANIGLGSGQTPYKWNDTRLGVFAGASGSFTDWGLTSWTQEKEVITIPRQGMWQLNWRVWMSPAPARTYAVVVYSAAAVREAVNMDAAGNSQAEFSSQFFLKKGDDLQFIVSIPSAATGGPDNRVDAATRSYMKLQYMGPGSA